MTIQPRFEALPTSRGRSGTPLHLSGLYAVKAEHNTYK